jgi:hypothetical protein
MPAKKREKYKSVNPRRVRCAYRYRTYSSFWSKEGTHSVPYPSFPGSFRPTTVIV